MPQYELMYLLGSHVADTEVPAISEQVKKFVADSGGSDIREQQLGKKKLAYPIKKTRNGFYVVVNFEMDSLKVRELDARIRAMDSTIIRYILVNLDEHLSRLAKDAAVQAKMPPRRIPEQAAETPAKGEHKAETPVALEINQEELDKKIEEALNEDMTK